MINSPIARIGATSLTSAAMMMNRMLCEIISIQVAASGFLRYARKTAAAAITTRKLRARTMMPRFGLLCCSQSQPEYIVKTTMITNRASER